MNRLYAITAVLAAGFLFNGAGMQHGALLQRQMRFTALAMINFISVILGTNIAIGNAKAGYDYWALVAMTVTLPLTTTVGVWLTTAYSRLAAKANWSSFYDSFWRHPLF